MTSQIDELERLNALRERGTLSEAEYAQAKERLLSGADTAPAAGRTALSPWMVRGAGLVGLALAVFVIKPLFNADPVAGSPQALAAVETSSDDWEVGQKQDPLTDVTIVTASRTFEGQNADIKLAVSCSSQGAIEYVATSFDKSGKPTEMQVQQNNWHPVVPYEVRIDRDDMQHETYYEPRFNNQVVMTYRGTRGEVYGGLREPASAAMLTLGFHLLHGDETIEVDQTAPSFTSLVAPCIAQHAERARRDAQQDQAQKDQARAKEEQRRRSDTLAPLPAHLPLSSDTPSEGRK